MELSGSRVLLRPVTAEDVDALTRMFSEPAVARWWVGYDRARIEREILHHEVADETVYVVEVDHEVAGTIQCYEEPEPEYRSASIDIAIATEWHGRGVAVDALRTLARDLIDRRGHHHLTIDPAAANARAIACYAKVGFRPVGVLRRNERGQDGTFHDSLLMDLVAEELR
jgi:aminoglycoside 6'-N-acetyltransferase